MVVLGQQEHLGVIVILCVCDDEQLQMLYLLVVMMGQRYKQLLKNGTELLGLLDEICLQKERIVVFELIDELERHLLLVDVPNIMILDCYHLPNSIH